MVSSIARCLLQGEVERAAYGRNKASVAEALEGENRRMKTINSYQKQLDVVFLQVSETINKCHVK